MYHPALEKCMPAKTVMGNTVLVVGAGVGGLFAAGASLENQISGCDQHGT